MVSIKGRVRRYTNDEDRQQAIKASKKKYMEKYMKKPVLCKDCNIEVIRNSLSHHNRSDLHIKKVRENIKKEIIAEMNQC